MLDLKVTTAIVFDRSLTTKQKIDSLDIKLFKISFTAARQAYEIEHNKDAIKLLRKTKLAFKNFSACYNALDVSDRKSGKIKSCHIQKVAIKYAIECRDNLAIISNEYIGNLSANSKLHNLYVELRSYHEKNNLIHMFPRGKI